MRAAAAALEDPRWVCLVMGSLAHIEVIRALECRVNLRVVPHHGSNRRRHPLLDLVPLLLHRLNMNMLMLISIVLVVIAHSLDVLLDDLVGLWDDLALVAELAVH